MTSQAPVSNTTCQPTLRSTSIDITPTERLMLFGFAYRLEPMSGVDSRLEANILEITGADGVPQYIVSLDLLYGGDLTAALASSLGVSATQILVMGSHTHFAPGCDTSLPALGITDRGYVSDVATKITKAILSAPYQSTTEVSDASVQTEGLFVNRRRPTFGVGIPQPSVGRNVMAPNPKGSIDRDLRLVAFWRGDDLLAILWGVSCHPVSFPEGTLASACFPGRVREAIRGALGHDIPVLFAQGFSGDVRPASYSRRIPKSPKGLANFVRAGGALFAPMTMNRYDMWCSALAGHAHEALRRARTSGRNPVQVRRRDSQITSPPGWRRDPRLTRLDLSSNVSLIASNAEIVSERVKDLVAAGGTRTFLPVGCCDAVIGYWPTDKMRRQGGYEGRQSQCNFPALDWDSVGGADKAWRSLLSAVMSET